MNAVARGDRLGLIGSGRRVDASRIFRLTASYVPGINVIDGGVAERDERYEELYRKLRTLARQRAAAPDDVSVQREHGEILSRLRALQREEAEEVEELFQKSRHLPPGQGYRVLDMVREELSDGAGSSHSNQSSD